MAAGPSIMASVGLDASGVNAGAAKVVSKVREMGKATADAARQSSRTIATGVDMRRGAGLATGDPAAFFNADKIEARKAKRLALLQQEERESGIATERAMLAEERARQRGQQRLEREAARARAKPGVNPDFIPLAKTEKTLKEMEKGATKAAKSTSALGGAAKTLGAYLTVDFLARQTKSVISYGSEVSDIADRLGISSTAVQQWDYATKQNGATMEDASRFFVRLASSRDKAMSGNENMVAAFKKLGVTVDDLKTKRLEEIGLQIGKAFESGDPQQFIAELREIGGRGAAELVTTFASGMSNLFAEAPIIPPETIAQLDIIDDKFASIAASFKSGMAEAIVGIVEVVAPIFDAFKVGLAGVIGYAEGTWKGIKDFFAGGDPKDAVTGKFGITGALEAMSEYKQGLALEKKRKEDAKAKRKPFAGGLEDEESPAEKRREERAEEKARREEERVRKQAEREKALADRQEAQRQIADLNEQQQLLRGAARPHAVNALQQMGGFLGNFASSAAPEVALLNSQLRVLEKIEAHLRGKGGGSSEEAEVVF